MTKYNNMSGLYKLQRPSSFFPDWNSIVLSCMVFLCLSSCEKVFFLTTLIECLLMREWSDCWDFPSIRKNALTQHLLWTGTEYKCTKLIKWMESFEDLGVHSVSVRSGFGKVLKSTVKQFYKAFMGKKTFCTKHADCHWNVSDFVKDYDLAVNCTIAWTTIRCVNKSK